MNRNLKTVFRKNVAPRKKLNTNEYQRFIGLYEGQSSPKTDEETRGFIRKITGIHREMKEITLEDGQEVLIIHVAGFVDKCIVFYKLEDGVMRISNCYRDNTNKELFFFLDREHTQKVLISSLVPKNFLH